MYFRFVNDDNWGDFQGVKGWMVPLSKRLAVPNVHSCVPRELTWPFQAEKKSASINEGWYSRHVPPSLSWKKNIYRQKYRRHHKKSYVSSFQMVFPTGSIEGLCLQHSRRRLRRGRWVEFVGWCCCCWWYSMTMTMTMMMMMMMMILDNDTWWLMKNEWWEFYWWIRVWDVWWVLSVCCFLNHVPPWRPLNGSSSYKNYWMQQRDCTFTFLDWSWVVSSSPAATIKTVTIPCHHVQKHLARLSDLVSYVFTSFNDYCSKCFSGL